MVYEEEIIIIMIEYIQKGLLLLIFGKDALRGYYDPKNNTELPKKYIFDSVFPDKKTMDVVLKEVANHKV